MNKALPTPSNSNFPAILFEPDGYVLDGPKLMGRQAAGHGFLRALISAAETRDAESLVAWTLSRDSARVFAQVVGQQALRVGRLDGSGPGDLCRRRALHRRGVEEALEVGRL